MFTYAYPINPPVCAVPVTVAVELEFVTLNLDCPINPPVFAPMLVIVPSELQLSTVPPTYPAINPEFVPFASTIAFAVKSEIELVVFPTTPPT